MKNWEGILRKWPWFALSLVIIFIDQVSKYWMSRDLIPYEPKAISPMLNLTLAYNTGAAFSFLNNTGDWHRWILAGFSTIMSLLLIVWILRSASSMRLQLIALSLILGGAIGNLIDRAMFGYVIDFIEVYYKSYHWPVFNIADSAICIGAFLLFIDLVRK